LQEETASLSLNQRYPPRSLSHSLSVCNVRIFFFGFICSGFLRCKIYDSLSFDELGFLLCFYFYKNGAHLCVLGFERWVLFVSFSFYSLNTLEEEVLFGYRF